MTSIQPKSKRGVVFTPTGWQKLQEAIAVWEEDNFGEKLTIEELSDHTKLNAGMGRSARSLIRKSFHKSA